MTMWLRRIVRHVCGLAAVAVLGGLGAATLARMAPGFDADEREFDPRLSAASIQALKNERSADRNVGKFYLRYLRGMVHGDFGSSISLRRPVAELLQERGPVTLKLAGWGLAGGWVFGLSLAIVTVQRKLAVLDLFSASLSALFLCLPAAVVGLAILFIGAAPWWAIALIIFPKVFGYARSLLEKVNQAPHTLLARAKGLGNQRILWWHVLPSMLPEMLALAGISVSLAFSVAIPLEAVCDVPGLGQLAWQAALGRDLPVLVTVTLLLALATRAANAAADLAISAVRE